MRVPRITWLAAFCILATMLSRESDGLVRSAPFRQYALAFFSGKLLAATEPSESGTGVGVYSMETGLRTSLLKGHKGNISSIAISEDEATIAGGGTGRPAPWYARPWDGSVRIWQATTGQLLGEYPSSSPELNFPPGITSLGFSPDGNFLGVGDSAGKFRMLGVKEHKCLFTVALTKPTVTRSVSGLQFSEDGKEVLVRTERSVHILNVLSGEPVAVFEDSEIRSASMSSDARYMVIQTNKGRSRVWSTSDNELLCVLQGARGFRCFAKFAGNSLVVAANNEFTGDLYNLQPWMKVLRTEGDLMGIDVSNDGRRAISWGSMEDRRKGLLAVLWAVDGARVLARIPVPPGFELLGFSKDGKTFCVVGHGAQPTRVFSSNTGLELRELSLNWDDAGSGT